MAVTNLAETSRSPLVTIVIDNFNYERYVGAAIDSALDQTYERTQVIVVDDGSTDSSRSILNAYRDRAEIILKSHAGQGSAFNVGFAASAGDVVIFLDADDVLGPRAAQAAAKALCGRQASVVHWPLAVVDQEGAWVRARIPRLPLSAGDLRSEAIRYGPAIHISPPTSGNAWSREFLTSVLPMPEETFRDCADNYLFTLSPIYGEILVIKRPLSCYRMHGANRYAAMTVLEKAAHMVSSYYERCQHLQRHLAAQGVLGDPETWRSSNRHYQWLCRVHRTLVKICDAVPSGDAFVLVDGGKLGARGMVVPRRFAFPFAEHDGAFSGLPWRDSDAETELNRLRGLGASYLVIIRDLLWWLDRHPDLANRWDVRHRRVIADDDVVIYKLE